MFHHIYDHSVKGTYVPSVCPNAEGGDVKGLVTQLTSVVMCTSEYHTKEERATYLQ
jgi:hypothetical protein